MFNFGARFQNPKRERVVRGLCCLTLLPVERALDLRGYEVLEYQLLGDENRNGPISGTIFLDETVCSLSHALFFIKLH